MRAAIAGIVLAIAIAAMAWVGHAFAQFQGHSSAGTGQFAVSINSAASLTYPPSTTFAVICVEGQAARWRDDGTAPTASYGNPFLAGTCMIYAGPFGAFQIIGQTSGATIDVAYYR